jgi:prepilin-type N-terminal cleavage/methylation domain-containing protein
MCVREKMKNKKFTLIELLVVISILGILMSILLPSLSQARAKTKTAVCISNLKQVGHLIYLYSGSNNDKLPGPNWHSIYGTYHDSPHLEARLAVYAGLPKPIRNTYVDFNLTFCPSFNTSTNPSSNYRRNIQFMMIGKNDSGEFYFGSNVRRTDPKNIAEIEDASDENALYEYDQLQTSVPKTTSPTPRHGKKGSKFLRTALWFDGHAKATTESAKY